MAFERLVGLTVADSAGYQAYRDAMTPILARCGGRFRYDFIVSKTLKNMRKLIKKAFPELVEANQWERIIMAHGSHGGNLNISQQMTNLYLCGGQYADGIPYLTSAIKTAQTASAEIITRQAGIAEKNMYEDVGL